jgi:[acyl-carrier-protein] S-malonyltransferase
LHQAAAPVVANDDGLAHAQGEEWRLRSARHVAVPVRWREAQLTLAGLGATALIEVGHGSMLAALAKRTTPDAPVLGLATPEDAQALDAETELV